MRPPASASGSGLGELTLWLCRARGGVPGARAPNSLQRKKYGRHFPFYEPLPACTVDWYMLPTHPLHAALAARLDLGPDAIIAIQGKACFPVVESNSIKAEFNTERDETHRGNSGYHVNDKRLQVFQLQVLVGVVDGKVILTKPNLKPFSKAFGSEVRAASRPRAARGVIAGRRTSAEQGQLLLEVFVTMPELETYGLFDEDGFLIQIEFPVPDGRPCGAPADAPAWVEKEGQVFLPDTSVSSPDILGLVAPELKMTAGGLKRNLTKIRNGENTDWSRLYRHMYVPADAARFLRGETRLVSVMDGDGSDQAVLGAWPARGWHKGQKKRQKKRQPQPRKKRR